MIDIIVPVYNAEKLLKRCVDSILMQTNPNWNMILVDDGSIDNSGKICDYYAQEYNGIIAIHKPNGGVSSARNVGIDNSSNEYIMFIDSDDWVQPNLIEKLFSTKSKADVIVGGYAVKGIPSIGSQMLPDRYLTIGKIGEVFPQMVETNLANSPCSKVYRRSIIGNQRFDETVALGEDFLFNLDYFRKCKTIEIVECDSYVYDCTNTDSATKRFREKDIDQIVNLYREGKKFEREFCGDGSCGTSLEKRLCENGINMLQMIFASKNSCKKKRTFALKLLDGKEFSASCKGDFRLPLILEVPRQFCKWHSIVGIRFFFMLKDIGRVIVK